MASIWTKLPKGVQRRAARWFGCRPCRIRLQAPLISFTFDDFPRSALLTGGAILQKHGAVGTYYTSLGLMGQMTSTGQIFAREDLDELIRNQHEIACHTFDHCDSWGTEPADFEASVRRNQLGYLPFSIQFACEPKVLHVERAGPLHIFGVEKYPVQCWPRLPINVFHVSHFRSDDEYR